MPSFVLFVLIAQCALSSAFKTAVEYSKQESGYCREDEGWLYLADFEECAAAAAALGQKCNDCDERNAESRDDRALRPTPPRRRAAAAAPPPPPLPMTRLGDMTRRPLRPQVSPPRRGRRCSACAVGTRRQCFIWTGRRTARCSGATARGASVAAGAFLCSCANAVNRAQPCICRLYILSTEHGAGVQQCEIG